MRLPFCFKWLSFRTAIILSVSIVFSSLPGFAQELTPLSGNRQDDTIRRQSVLLQPLAYQETEILEPPRDQLILIPRFSIQTGTDQNFYLTEENEREVLRILVQPGVQLVYDTGKSSIGLGYTLNAHYFEDLDDPDEGEKDASDDNYVGHTFDFFARTTPTPKINLGLEDVFLLTEEPSKADRISNDTRRERYYVNRFTPMVLYSLTERISFDLRYRNTLTEYDDDTDEDSIEHAGIFGLNYQIRPTLWATLGYQHWYRNYDVDVSDYSADNISLTLRKQAKYNLYEASIGYQDRRFDERDDEDTFTYLLAYTRTLGRTTYARAAFEQNFNESGIAENFFKATQLTLDFGKTFRDKIPVTLDAFYRHSEYQQDSILKPDGEIEDREDDRYGIAGSVGYHFKRWLTLVLTAGYEWNHSNLDRFDYDNSFVSLGANVALDFNYRWKDPIELTY